MSRPTAAAAHSASKLSHLSTTTLSSALEATRLQQLEVALPTHLSSSIQRNLAQLARGINALDEDGRESDDVVTGLKAQFQRLVGLVEPLGIAVEERLREDKGKGKTGRLVETDDEREDGTGGPGGEDGVPLQPVGQRPPHIAISMHDDAEASRDIEQMEEDEEEMRRANSEVMQMQRRMMEDQDEQLDSLSSAISRQHALSLRVAEELELHSSLLDDTDEALDRTENNLRRASGRLDQFTRRARDTGSTGLIIGLIILLVILIVIFKF
ncbi:hypothetical protein JCM10207_005341 [Rhodosporidiobolus poonsookiae]